MGDRLAPLICLPPTTRLTSPDTIGGTAILEIQGLVKRYGRGETALQGVDLHVPAGQVMALIGPSGAGKSTLIRCVNRLVEPTEGTIRLADVELTSLGKADLRRARVDIGMIFQEHALVDRLTVMENVLSGQLGSVGFWASQFRRFPADTVARSFELLKRVGIEEQLDKRADQLSGGQRQRVGIARALLQDPKILLIDEPTASLDPKTSRQVMRLLIELARENELAAIINIHDVALATQFVERIVGLREGKVVFDGPPAELTEAVLTEIYGEEDWTAPKKRGGSHDDADDASDEEDDDPLDVLPQGGVAGAS